MSRCPRPNAAPIAARSSALARCVPPIQSTPDTCTTTASDSTEDRLATSGRPSSPVKDVNDTCNDFERPRAIHRLPSVIEIAVASTTPRNPRRGNKRAFRQAFINTSSAPDIVLALHFNGSEDASQSGTEVYYNPDRSFGQQNVKLAMSVYDALLAGIRGLGYTVHPRGVMNDAPIGERFDLSEFTTPALLLPEAADAVVLRRVRGSFILRPRCGNRAPPSAARTTSSA